MADSKKTAERSRRAKGFRELIRSLAGVSRAVYRPTASSIFDSLSQAHLNEQNAASSQLSRDVLFGENPEATVPDELSDATISEYLASAGGLYEGAATDYMLIYDLPRAFKYYRKAAQNCRKAAEFSTEDGPKLLEKAQEYRDKATVIRQQLARKSLRRRRFSLGFLARLR